jgi:diguanylate cyclase (GGDEF)-like protein
MRADQDNERRARRDALTDLLNRNGLERAIEAKWSQRQSGTEQFALLYIDLDGFKAVNDRHGPSRSTNCCGSSPIGNKHRDVA